MGNATRSHVKRPYYSKATTTMMARFAAKSPNCRMGESMPHFERFSFRSVYSTAVHGSHQNDCANWKTSNLGSEPQLIGSRMTLHTGFYRAAHCKQVIGREKNYYFRLVLRRYSNENFLQWCVALRIVGKNRLFKVDGLDEKMKKEAETHAKERNKIF